MQNKSNQNQDQPRKLIDRADRLIRDGRLDLAAVIYADLCRQYPRVPEFLHLHGLVLYESGVLDAALEKITRAVELSPDQAVYHRSRADVLQAMGQAEQAVQAYERALTLDVGDPDTMLNLGNTLEGLNRPEAARQYYLQVIQKDANHIKALNNLGKLDADLGFTEKAVRWYQKALAIDPDYAEARFNRAVALLSLGDYQNGWREYEWRFRRRNARRVYPHAIESPRWNGEPYPDRRLMVHCEQGLGDVLQFARYLPRVKRLGGTLIVEVHPALLPVLENMDGIDHLVGFNARRPSVIAHDLHAPLLSLPYILGTGRDTLSSRIPYLRVDESRRNAWKNRFRGKSPHVGLVWAGSGLNPRRNLDVHQLKPLFDVPDVQFYSLQTGRPAEQLAVGAPLPITPLGHELADFGDTAAIMTHLDLIISVDTAAAHLAGALGRPLWVLLPTGADWRWPSHRTNSPWYPEARLFRLTDNRQWNDVVKDVACSLNEFVHGFRLNTYTDDQIRQCMTNAYQLLHNGQSEKAVEQFRKVTACQPENAAAHYNLGLALQQRHDIHGAMAAYLKALSLHPRLEQAWSNLGAIHLQQKNPSAARECFQKAIELNPRAGTYYNLGNTFLLERQPQKAVEHYEKALSLDPGHLKTLNNMGRAWHILGRYDISRRYLDKAIELDPNYPEARLNSAVNRLLLGDWDKGWQEYGWRFQCHDGPRPYPHRRQARPWQGQSIYGQRILITSEQGLGDAIQFCRYIPMIQARGGRVIFEVRPSLHPLFKTLAGVHELAVVSSDGPYSGEYEWFAPLVNCPRIFGTIPDTVPARAPYLAADPVKISHWKSRRSVDCLNVGLVWAGSDTYPERSLTLDELSTLAELPGIRWHGLQKGHSAGQADPGRRPTGFNLVNWGDELQDFSDTAALIANLDLIITIDTSVAHLAGAMGKPTWLLLHAVPDWRWMLNRSDSLWYPDMTLFRQSRWNQWDEVIDRVKQKLHALGRGICVKNIELQSDEINLFNSALKYKQAGQYDRAVEFFNKAVALNPKNTEIHYNLANTHLAAGHADHAINAYRRVLEYDPNHPPALNNLGLAYKKTGDLARAESVLKQAVALQPDNALFLNNLGTTLQARQKFEAAIEHFRHAIAAHPENAETYFNLGCSLQHIDALEAAAESYQAALALKPDFFDAHNNLGITFRLLGRFGQARTHHDHAVLLRPRHDDAHWNRSLLHLLHGDWSRGWPEFEYRLTQSGWLRNYPHKHNTPRWDGSALNGRRILIHDEQGYGDTIQFARYLPLVKSRGGHVILETRRALATLLSGFDGIDELVVRSDDHRPDTVCDVHIPLLSLPLIFNTMPDTVPGTAPYLKADPRKAAIWETGIQGDGLNVGVVWAGNPNHQNDAQRSCPPELFKPLFELEGVRFFSMQKGMDPRQKDNLFQQYPLIDTENRLTDFTDAAGLIHHLDLIISVDTAVVHLAGAMGKPVWVLLPMIPDWRWLMDRTDSPWYPSARLFRQKRRGDWESVIGQVRDNLVSIGSEKN